MVRPHSLDMIQSPYPVSNIIMCLYYCIEEIGLIGDRKYIPICFFGIQAIGYNR